MSHPKRAITRDIRTRRPSESDVRRRSWSPCLARKHDKGQGRHDPPAVIFHQDMTVGAAVKAMRTRKIRHAPVINDKGALVGIVTDRDLRQAVLEPALAEEMQALSRTLRTRTVKDVMTWGAITVKPETEIRQAARLMHSNKIGALPVIQNGRVAGIVSGHDVLKTLIQILDEGVLSSPGDGARKTEASPSPHRIEGTTMKVKDVMAKDPFTIDPEAPFGTATDVMRTKHLRHLPVVDGRPLIGIITDRDLRHAAFGPAVAEYLSAGTQRRMRQIGETLENLRVRDAMTWVVVTIHPNATLPHAALLMFERRVGSLPVVEDGKLVGMLTERDLLKALSREGPRVPTFDVEGFLW